MAPKWRLYVSCAANVKEKFQQFEYILLRRKNPYLNYKRLKVTLAPGGVLRKQ